MKLIFVSSPLRGDFRGNVEKARKYARFVCDAGHSPVVPHLTLTQFLNDDVENERAVGIACGMKYLEKSDEAWFFAEDERGCSPGMAAELAYARELGKPVRFVRPSAV